MSLLDLLLILIVGGSVVGGFMAGFARAGVGFLAAVAGVLFGFWFYGIPAAWIRRYVESPTLSNLAGFLVVFLACVLLGALIGKLLAKLLKWTGLSWLDRLMGAGFGLVRGAVAAVALVIPPALIPRLKPTWFSNCARLVSGKNTTVPPTRAKRASLVIVLPIFDKSAVEFEKRFDDWLPKFGNPGKRGSAPFRKSTTDANC